MTVSERLLTADELWALPDDGNRHELVRGELRTMAPAGSGHGAVIVNLTIPLGQYVRANHLGIVFGAETGFVIALGPDTVRAPDIGFVAASRIPQAGVPEKFFPGPPDLAVEVLSPGDTAYEVEEKVHEWLSAGTRLVWVLNPRLRTVAVHRPGPQVQILDEEGRLVGEDVISGFCCPVRELFA